MPRGKGEQKAMNEKKTFLEMLLFKIDRTLAILVVGVLGSLAVFTLKEQSVPIVNSAITALGVLLGVRIANKGDSK
jgi:hypothetical protein